jgi:hypothetical protein
MTYIHVTARVGNNWKISRIIRNVEDANRAIRDFRSKLKAQTPRDERLTCKVDRFEESYWLGSEKYIEVAMLDYPLLIEAYARGAGLLPSGHHIPAVHDDLKLVESSANCEQQAVSSAVELAGEIQAEADGLLTVCHLLQQTVLRSREWWEDNRPVAFVLKPVLDTHDLLDRRIRQIRENGEAISGMLEAA